MRRSQRISKIAVVALLAAACLLSGSLHARQSGKLVIFVLDQITLEDLHNTDLPNIKRLFDQGAIGAMNVRVPHADTVSAGYVTIGAGNKADGVDRNTAPKAAYEPQEGFGANETVNGRRVTDIQYERTRERPSADGAANISINAIVKKNKENDFGAVPGSLGNALKAAGLKTAALGNIDTSTGYGRPVIDIVMDGHGLVDYSALGRELIQKDGAFPTGYRTDPSKLQKDFEVAYRKADVIAVDWGDTTRVYNEDAYLNAATRSHYLKSSLKRADDFLGGILKDMDLNKDVLIVVTPQPSPAAFKNNNLITPVIIAGRGVEKGLLVTQTTRKPGVLVNVDIAPTVLDFFGLDTPPEIIGQPLSSQAFEGDRFDYLISLNKTWVDQRNFQAPVLRTFAFWAISLMLFFMLLLLVPSFHKYAVRFRSILLSVPIAPLVILLLGFYMTNSLAFLFGALFIATASFTAIVYYRHRDPVAALGVIGLVIWATLLLDMFSGGILANNSLLGYSIVGGSRFYGIGNEYMGVLIGAATLASFYVVDRFQSAGFDIITVKAGVAVALAATAVVIGYAGLGANFGGLLAALAAFSVMSLGYLRGRIRIKDLVVGAVAAAVLAGLLIAADMFRGAANGSHVARLVETVTKEGIDPLAKVIERKVMMNLKLVQYAFWNWVNIASAGVLIVAFYGLKNLLKLVFQSHKYYQFALTGGLVGCVTALLFNDSGVVAMALIFTYLVPATLYLMSYEVGT